MSMTKPIWETPVLTKLNTGKDTRFGSSGFMADATAGDATTTTTGPGWS